VPEDVFLDEMEFYQLGDNVIQDYKEKEGFIMEKKMLLPKVCRLYTVCFALSAAVTVYGRQRDCTAESVCLFVSCLEKFDKNVCTLTELLERTGKI